eukprot:94606_1
MLNCQLLCNLFLLILALSNSDVELIGWVSNNNLSLPNTPQSLPSSIAAFDYSQIWILNRNIILSLDLSNFTWNSQHDTIDNETRLPLSDTFQNTVYYINQPTDGSTLSVLWQFPFKTQSSTNIATFNRIDSSICIHKQYKLLFLVGGVESIGAFSAAVSDVIIYSLQTNKQLSNNIKLTQPRYKHLCVIVNNTLYVFGGKYNDILSTIEKIEIYEYLDTNLTVDHTFIQLTAILNTPRTEFQLVQGVMNKNLIYIIGGVSDDFIPLQSVEIFDVVSETVVIGPSLPESRYLLCTARTLTDIYIFGGCSDSICSWFRSKWKYPTVSPTAYPIVSLTNNPTEYSTNNINNDNDTHNSQWELNDWFFFSLFGLFVVVMILTLIGYCNGRRKKYRFEVVHFVNFFYNLYDFITDIMVSINIMNQLNGYDGLNVSYLIMFIVSILSIILPSMLNIFELNKSIKKWIKTDGSTTIWISRYVHSLYLSSVIIGNNQVSVKFFSCNFLKLDFFSLNVKHSRMIELQNSQYKISFMENIPQFIIEIWYLLYSHSFYDVALVSVIFNFLSMVVTVFTCRTQRDIIQQNALQNVEMLNDKLEDKL